MNFKMELTKQHQQLLQDIGLKIENRDYTQEEVGQYKSSVIDYIMSKSSKNGDIAKETSKYAELINILINNIN